jgi:hypothetical protein
MYVAFLGHEIMGVVDRTEPKSVAVEGIAPYPN